MDVDSSKGADLYNVSVYPQTLRGPQSLWVYLILISHSYTDYRSQYKICVSLNRGHFNIIIIM